MALLASGLIARAQTPATQPAAPSVTGQQNCHPTSLWLPKVSVSPGDAAASGEAALSNAMAARVSGNVGEQRSDAAQAAAFFLAAQEKSREGAALQVMAVADESMAHYTDAICELEEAGSIADRLKDAASSASAHSNVGAVETLTRAYDDASFDLNLAMTRAQEVNDERLQAEVLNNFGNLHAAMAGVARSREKYSPQDREKDKAEGDAYEAQAMEEFDQAVRLAGHAKEPILAAKAATNAAVAAARDGQFADANRRSGDALARVSSLADSHEKAYLLTTIGDIEARVANHTAGGQRTLLNQACSAFERAIICARAIDDTLAESYATGMFGSLYEAHDAESEAMALSRRASFLAQKAQSPDSLYRWQWQTARLLAKQDGGRDDAIAEYTRAADNLKLVRSDIALGHGNGDPRSSFRTDVGPLYFQLADLLLRRAEDPQRTPDESRDDLVAARDIVERLKSGELEDYFQDECVNQNRVKERAIAALDEHTAVVYVIPLEDRIELLVDLPGGAGLREVRKDGVGRAKLEEEVQAFRSALENVSRSDLPRRYGAELYEWLILPIEPLLKEYHIQTLVTVPDGLLRTVPMAALFDSRTQQFLIEQYATAVTPGLTLMQSQPIARKNVRLLLSGLSVPRFGFAALPSVPRELQNINDAFPDQSKQLLNSQFVTGTFRTELHDEQYTIVHIASHGEFKGDAKQTFILAFDQRLTLDDLQALIQPSEFRGRPIELLTLSACRTAEGDDRAALGLAGVAIKAGARSALASLWSVNDASSSELIADFYQELSSHPGLSKAQALQLAQLRLLNDADFSHPKYWSPFIVIGNWL